MSATCNAPINSKLQHPPQAIHRHLPVAHTRRRGEFNPYLGGVGHLNRKCQIFPELNTLVLMEDFQGKESAFVSEWLGKIIFIS